MKHEPDHRPSALRSGFPVRPARPHDTTLIAKDHAKYNQHADIAETVEDHVIPRESITAKYVLGLIPQTVETETMPGRQLDHKSGKMIETTDQRVTWRSDRTLLTTSNPFRDPEAGNRSGFKREGKIIKGQHSRTYRESVPNADPNPDKIIGYGVDGLDDLD